MLVNGCLVLSAVLFGIGARPRVSVEDLTQLKW